MDLSPHSGTIEFDDNVNIASGLITSQQSIGVALEVSCIFNLSAKLVLMLGTLQSQGLGGIFFVLPRPFRS